MSGEITLDYVVTQFLLNTCRRSPQLCPVAVQAALRCGETVDVKGMHLDHEYEISDYVLTQLEDEDAECIPLTTGSVAEFYIRPMLSPFGDIDLMCYRNTQLAIPRGHPPPTQLPAEFHNYVQVWEIINSLLPGYVYLELRYLLTQCSDDDKYNAVEYDRGQYLTNNSKAFRDIIHGPAVCIPLLDTSGLSADGVYCVRCLSWPLQAADWPTRHRSYGWPDSATLDRVVSNGCDVVGVAHRQCRQHQVMGKRQWRLSFSRAEIVLCLLYTSPSPRD